MAENQNCTTKPLFFEQTVIEDDPTESLNRYLRFTTTVILLLAFFLLIRKKIRSVYGKNFHNYKRYLFFNFFSGVRFRYMRLRTTNVLNHRSTNFYFRTVNGS